MYLIGAELTGTTGFASMVLIQRIRKNLKKYYHVLSVKRSPANSGEDDLIAEIENIYKDAAYTIRKPRYSQIGRPKKMINERPVIFIGCDSAKSERINDLKKRKIPANCVHINDEETWRVQIPGACLKSDFYIPKAVIIRSVLGVIEQDRLVMGNMPIAAELLEGYKKYREISVANLKTENIMPLDDLALALSMPVWYYENLLAIRPRTP